MRQQLLTAVLSLGLLFSAATPGFAITHTRHHYYSYSRVRHKRHMKTLKRVGGGAVAGAAVGALVGHGPGAAIGAAAGAGAGALYDRHEKHTGHY
jgi:uncharacterized protein YcfJ